MNQPLILTLQIDETAQSFYDALRRQYFPSELNLIPAHLTLFHHLPHEDRTIQLLLEASKETHLTTLSSAQVRSIGRGVAVFFQSQQLTALHAALSSSFHTCLIPQDRQKFQPHIVVQNKVDPTTARQTLTELAATPLPEPRPVGLTLWRYLGGPWEHLNDFPFNAPA